MRIDKLRAFEAAIVPIFARLPLRVAYNAVTLSGRCVRVVAEYDPGWSDTAGPVARYARILRVMDRATHRLLVDGGLVDDGDPVDGLALVELEQLEAAALSSCEFAVCVGGFRQ